MIQELSTRFQKGTAALLFAICFNGMILPTHALGNPYNNTIAGGGRYTGFESGIRSIIKAGSKTVPETKSPATAPVSIKKPDALLISNSPSIGGPTQPEMSAFKSAGTDNMVNLFTGDFSYNIPLMDVGGYPVNIFYDGGVGMEQEASWVGLGWNINPGNINRNMRGIPDDFNGEDIIEQTQKMKQNITWGAKLGADIELVGTKLPVKGAVGASIGVSFNNYLGPALDIGIRGNTAISLTTKTLAEKNALPLGGSLSINASSRSGVTFTPGISLTSRSFAAGKYAAVGFGLNMGTSYNSRSGIKEIQISEQMKFNQTEGKIRMMIPDATLSNSISFTKPSYIPSLRMPLTSTAFSGHFQYGGGIFGVAGDAEVEVYQQNSFIASEDEVQRKPMVGYLYLENGNNNQNAVLDFTRINDNEVTPNTPIISAPQYSYDVFSIQGEGTGGSVRAYRNDDGYMRDKYTLSKDKSVSVGADVDPPGHYGGNVNIIKTPSVITEWGANNKLRYATGFKSAQNSWENVYFRNPGESGVLNANQYDKIGGIDLVRYKLGGTKMSPSVEPVLQRFTKNGSAVTDVNILTAVNNTDRKKRTQVINFLNAEDAAVIGLDKKIKSYDGTTILDAQKNLKFTEMERVDNVIRKKHHISQINVTEANGQRYVYGIPVYNLVQKDFTFTVSNLADAGDPDKVTTNSTEPENLNTSSGRDGYLQKTVTPAYASSFLLSGLLSPDYVDVNGDGITEDDLGNAVKFNYTKMSQISKWRTPLADGYKANFIAGKRSEDKDNKGIISYGERESWYMHSIESKTMVAIFTLESRKDGKGSATEIKDINNSDESAKRLKQIDLYNKADLKKNGLAGAKPVKTVHFKYSYRLCGNSINNNGGSESYAGETENVNAKHGKLTLEKIWFTFNGQNRANKNQYVFSYGATEDNPDYAFNASDRWGTYKPHADNPLPLRNADYPYSLQDKTQKTLIDKNAGAWMLKKILLPSGGQMEVNYETDDYAFVQNKRAADMMAVAGFGQTNATPTNQLYAITPQGVKENDYAFIKVPEACASADEVYQKYFAGIDQLSFKLAVVMPKGTEMINSYAVIDPKDCGLYAGDGTNKTVWVKMNRVDNRSPLSLTAIEFLREQLPGQAYEGYDVSESEGLEQIGRMMKGWLQGLAGAFTNPVNQLRSEMKAQNLEANKSFVRLNDPDGFKYGGGYRVKSIRLKDNWKEMNSGNLYTSEYGQDYDYTTKEIFNGVERSISSGVASYEPSLGGDENPFQTMVQVSNKIPLGPASYGAVEMPMLDAFFPAPSVGYSKVTVTAVKKGTQDPTKKSRSGIGKQVTQFYTAKDYPVYYNYTAIDPSSDLQANTSSSLAFFYKYAFDSRALSQGFVVETNDMHGKMKSQASYPENDDKTPINFTENFYRNTGANGMNEKFDFVYATQGGAVTPGNQGIDVELMTDTREFSVKSKSIEIQGQLDLFPVFFSFWLPFVWPVAGNNENTYRAVTTTKVVNYHSVLDSVSVVDKGSQVGTKNLVFDSETGDVIVNRTNNEFKQPIYSTNYPAWWAYSGMSQAYKNIDAVFRGVTFRDGKITGGSVPASVFESGDELLLLNEGSIPTDECASVFNTALPADHKLWAFDKNKPVSGLTNQSPDFYFIDRDGKLFTRSGMDFRIIRSGKRNMLNASAGSVVSMASPVKAGYLKIDNNSKAISAGAVKYKEKWKNDNDLFKKYVLQYPPVLGNLVVNGNFESGYTGFTAYGSGNSAVGTNPHSWNSNMSSVCRDHTSGSGNMLMLDGANNAGASAWAQTVTVIPNTNYEFTVWVQGISTTDDDNANLYFKINGVAVGSYPILDHCNWHKCTYTWNSGTNTTAALSVIDIKTVVAENDFALDDISFIKTDCEVQVEVEDCNGYPAKNINPYVKGLLGNFKAAQSMVFYHDKTETTPATATNLPGNGFLANFKLYWDFDGASNLVPDEAGTKWVWNSKVNKYNAKGMELETNDALNIYTAAQYGFSNTLPVAISNNARFGEAAGEGFEDAAYNGNVNNNSYLDCRKKYIDLSGLTNSTVTDRQTAGVQPHSGNYMMKVNANATAVKALNIADYPQADPDFNLEFGQSATGDLVDLGVNVINTRKFPLTSTVHESYAYLNEAMNVAITQTNPAIFCHQEPNGSWGFDKYHDYTVTTSHYIKVTECNATYHIQTKSQNSYGFSCGSMSFKIYKLDGTEVPVTFTGIIGGDPQHKAFECNLDGGIYKVICENFNYGEQFCSAPQPTSGCLEPYDPNGRSSRPLYIDSIIKSFKQIPDTLPQNIDVPGNCTKSCGFLSTTLFQFKITDIETGSYSHITDACPATTPIAASKEMINPVFKLPVKKKMLFSAWVKETCGSSTVPCTLQTYTHSSVSLSFSTGSPVSFIPSGPIIEGWQKIEGVFMADEGVTSANLSFVNSSGQPVYFDDIRIHPYNANMKTYVYDPVNLRLLAEADANNYSSFYEYDDEGTLIRTKAETKEGVKTITETRSAKQKNITSVVE